MILIWKAGSYTFLLAAILLFSFGGAFWNPAAYSFMVKIGSKTGSVAEVMGIYNSVGKIGEFVGFIISGVIAYETLRTPFHSVRSFF